MTIQEVIFDRQIESVLHFTTNHGLVGTLVTGSLLSRHRLNHEHYLEHVLHVNAERRPEAAADFDKRENWLDYVNLSISEINRRYLDVSKRRNNNSGVWWCILSFNSDIMTHDRVAFATTNNSYTLCERKVGVEGLEALFAARIQRKQNWTVWRGGRPSNLPTCEQAEVLYPEAVSTEYLRCIYVEQDDHHDRVSGWLQEFGFNNVDVVISTEKFLGSPN